MNYQFKSFLTEKLNLIKNNNTYNFLGKEIDGSEINLVVCDEQVFAKQRSFAPNTIYVVIKYLQSTIQFFTETMPIQIMITCEQDQLSIAQSIVNEFATTWNWRTQSLVVNINNENVNVFIKHQYTSPVVLSNFMDVGNGYRSVIYFTGTIYEMDGYVDVDKITIDSVDYEVIGLSEGYQMTGDTQPVGDQRIATTEKSLATYTISFDIPMVNNNLVRKVFAIKKGSWSGNENFTIKLTYNFPSDNKMFGAVDVSDLTFTMKLLSCQVITAPNQVPSLHLAFMR